MKHMPQRVAIALCQKGYTVRRDSIAEFTWGNFDKRWCSYTVIHPEGREVGLPIKVALSRVKDFENACNA